MNSEGETTPATRRTVRSKAAIGLAGGSTFLAMVSVAGDASASYHTPWSRQNAYDYAVIGQNESYDFDQWAGGAWNDDNVRNNPATTHNNERGADCSGYANKVWAVPAYSAYSSWASGQSTSSWYAGTVDGSWLLALGDNPTNRTMDTWVKRTADNSGGHMGLYEGSRDGLNQWKIYHAKGTNYGIVFEYKPASWFLAGHSEGVDWKISKHYKRVNW